MLEPDSRFSFHCCTDLPGIFPSVAIFIIPCHFRSHTLIHPTHMVFLYLHLHYQSLLSKVYQYLFFVQQCSAFSSLYSSILSVTPCPRFIGSININLKHVHLYIILQRVLIITPKRMQACLIFFKCLSGQFKSI